MKKGTTRYSLPLALLLAACAVQGVETEELFLNSVALGDTMIAGGQPTTEELAGLHDAGYRTVINLRKPSESLTSAEVSAELGMSYIAIPIDGSSGLTEVNARVFAEALRQAETPMIVHCGSGNRVGAMFALKAFYVDGRSADEALEVGKASGLTALEAAVRERLGLPAELP